MTEVTLKKFTNEKGPAEAGRLLGCTAPAVIKAAKSKRKILVVELPDGTFVGEERRPFPSATARKAG